MATFLFGALAGIVLLVAILFFTDTCATANLFGEQIVICNLPW